MSAVATRRRGTVRAANSPLGSGAQIAPGYEVIAHLSRGRALDTYDAWSAERDCRCVIKAVRPDRLGEERPRRRLRREGRLACELNHPHLVRGYELIVRPQPLAVLETLDGETLEHMLRDRSRRLLLVDVAYLGMHLCSAMHYLHGRGHVHLDLKPSNVISDGGLAKVIDLSLARRPGRGQSGAGTIPYMAPEQARGGHVDAATDVWGIGAVLYEAATGQKPFSGLNGTRYPQLEHRPPPVSTLRRLPVGFASAIDSCLDSAPSDRPRVDEVSRVLRDFT
jgi:eukaryotic-like serine/threonine-protein kinase